MLTGGTLFEELGFYYVGPIDGHNLDHLLPVLRNVREAEETGPILVHAITQKGKGYAPAEASADKLHSVSKFNVITGEQAKAPPGPPTYTKVFAEALIAEAERDPTIVAITAAMPSGTGLDRFGKRFPDRTFDVGIAEQHAVTFAAGLATEGMKPFCAIYSTFLQRAYDQVVHDVAIQAPAGALRAGPRGAGGRRRGDALRQLRPRLSGLPAGVRADGAVRRGGVDACGGDRGGDRRSAVARCAIRAATGSGVALPARGEVLRAGQGPRAARGRTASPSCRWGRGWRMR